MYRESQCDRCGIGSLAHQGHNAVGRPEAISTHRPHRVLQVDERGVELLEFSAADRGVSIERDLEGRDLQIQAGNEIGDLGSQPDHLDERPHAGNAAQEQVRGLHQLGRLCHCCGCVGRERGIRCRGDEPIKDPRGMIKRLRHREGIGDDPG